MEPALSLQRVTRTRSSYNLTCPSSHFPFQPLPTSSRGHYLWSATPLGDLTQTQYFDSPAPPAASSPLSSPDSSLSGFLFSIHIDLLSDKEDNNNMVDIKAAPLKSSA